MLNNRKSVEKELFAKNKEYLPHALKERVLKVSEEEVWKRVKIDYDDEGPISLYRAGEKTFQITSIKPRTEAENWCKQLFFEDKGALFIYGSGFGYSLFELLKQKQPNTIIIVFEQDIYLFVAMLHFFDFKSIFLSQKFVFFIGDIEDFSQEFDSLFWSEVFLYCTNPSIVFTPAAQRGFKKEYYEIHKHIFNYLSLNITYLGNDYYDTLLGFHNLMDNVLEVMENPYISSLKDAFKDVPAFIVSNGPSLDKNIEQLHKVNGKGLIISCESSILPLMKNKIKPDAIAVLERIKEPYLYHFRDIKYADDISLLSLALIDPRIYRSFSGPRVPIFRSAETINKWMNGVVGDQSALYAGSNVSHLAFEAAAYMGANPIVFVGQDFAFGQDGGTHSKESIYSDEELKEHVSKIKSAPVIYVKGNEGKEVATTPLWEDLKKGLERVIKINSDRTIINATEGGAKIEGTTCDTLTNVIKKFCKAPLSSPLNIVIKENKKKIDKSERQKKLNSLVEELQNYIIQHRQYCQMAVKGMMRSKQMMELSEKENWEEVVEQLEQVFEDNFKEIKQLLGDGLYVCFLQQVLVICFHKFNQLGLIDSPEKSKQAFQVHYAFYQHLNVICQSLTVNFEMVREKIQEKIEGGQP